MNNGDYGGDRWWNRKVQGKMEVNKATYAKLVESKHEVEKKTNKEIYKAAKREAKLAVTVAKTTAFV